MPTFLYPWFFLSLLAIPALIAIYFLHSRSRRYVVSSLMLWLQERENREGGLRRERIRTPLLFFLELLVLLLLAVAAAVPMRQSWQGARPLIVILDNSCSMLAREAMSRKQAMRLLMQELAGERYAPVRFILAKEEATLIGNPTRTTAEAADVLEQWRCNSLTANLDAAIALAYELGGLRTMVIVASDHEPVQATGDGRLVWYAFGKATANIGFIVATRTPYRQQDRCMLEVANYSAAAVKTDVVLTIGQTNQTVPLDLKSNEIRRLVFEVNSDLSLQAKLPDDALATDNQVVLVPQSRRQVRVRNDLGSSKLKPLFDQALAASGLAVDARTAPDLLICEQMPKSAESPDTWIWQIEPGKTPAAYLGPFILDRTHPLCEGIYLQGAIWGAGQNESALGTPLITAGNLPLLTDTLSPTGRHHVRMKFALDLSTWHNTPSWPILIWNFLSWRVQHQPGCQEANVRLGTQVNFYLPYGVSEAEVVTPDGATRKLSVHARNVTLPTEQTGIYQVKTASGKYLLAANAVASDESNLEKCVTGQWGKVQLQGDMQWDYRNVSWWLLLPALLILAAHMGLIHYSGKR